MLLLQFRDYDCRNSHISRSAHFRTHCLNRVTTFVTKVAPARRQCVLNLDHSFLRTLSQLYKFRASK